MILFQVHLLYDGVQSVKQTAFTMLNAKSETVEYCTVTLLVLRT